VFSFTVRFTVLRSGFGSGFDVRCSGFEVRVAGSAFDSRCDVSQDLQRVITISSIPWAFRRHSACSTEPHDTRREAVHGFAGLAACDVFKKAIYRLCENKPIADALGRRKQLKESSSHTTVHIAEGFGRFNPADFAKFCTIARSSLMESQNHLLDFVNKRYISEEGRLEPGRSHNESRTERRTEQRTL